MKYWIMNGNICIKQSRVDSDGAWLQYMLSINALGLRQNGRRFADDIFNCIFLNGNLWISLKISLNFVPEVRFNNLPALIQIMAWRRSGDKPLSGTMMVNLLTHICVTRPQWVKDAAWPESRAVCLCEEHIHIKTYIIHKFPRRMLSFSI